MCPKRPVLAHEAFLWATVLRGRSGESETTERRNAFVSHSAGIRTGWVRTEKVSTAGQSLVHQLGDPEDKAPVGLVGKGKYFL